MSEQPEDPIVSPDQRKRLISAELSIMLIGGGAIAVIVLMCVAVAVAAYLRG